MKLVMRAKTGGCDRPGLAGLGEHCPASGWWIPQVGQTGWAEKLRPEVGGHQLCSSLPTQATDTQPPPSLIPISIPLPALTHKSFLPPCGPHHHPSLSVLARLPRKLEGLTLAAHKKLKGGGFQA